MVNSRLQNFLAIKLRAALNLHRYTLSDAANKRAEEIYRIIVSEETEKECLAFPHKMFFQMGTSFVVTSSYGHWTLNIPVAKPLPIEHSDRFIPDTHPIHAVLNQDVAKLNEPEEHLYELANGIIELVRSCRDHRQLHALWPGVQRYVPNFSTYKLSTTKWPTRNIKSRKRKLTEEEKLMLTKYTLYAKVPS